MFKIVDGYEWAKVSKDGQVWSVKRDKPYALDVDRYGYLKARTKHKGKNVRCLVHRLVAMAYIPNPENKPQVNHKDSDRKNNHVDNLEWVTPEENSRHAQEKGRFEGINKGESNGYNKYSEDIIHKVCSMLEQGLSNSEIVSQVGCQRKLPYDIRRGKSWKHISKHYKIGGQSSTTIPRGSSPKRDEKPIPYKGDDMV